MSKFRATAWRAPSGEAPDSAAPPAAMLSEPTPKRRLVLAAVTVAALALAIRASVLRDAFFITDDYMLASRAMENTLSLDYLTRVHTGHFEPIGFTVMWLLAHFAPFSWWWASVFLLASQALLSVLVWQLLVEMFGRRYLVLLPFTIFCFSSLTIAAFTWLAAGIIWLPLMIAMAGMLRFHLRYIRDGRSRDAGIALLWFVVGLASFEKILLVLPFTVAFTLALEAIYRGRWRPSIGMLRRQWQIWVGYVVLSLVYIWLYIRGSSGDDASAAMSAPGPGQLGDFIVLSLGRTFVPGLFGGPWSWSPIPYGLAIVDSPRLFDWVCWALFVAMVIGSLILRRNRAWLWTALAIYLLFSLAIIALGRVAYMGTAFGLETRYLADAVIPVVMIIGACFMPLRGEQSSLTAEGRSVARQFHAIGKPLLAGGLAIFVVLAMHSMAAYSSFSSNNFTRLFVTYMQNSLKELPEDAQIVDTEMPPNVLTPLWGDYNYVSRFIAPLVPEEERELLYSRRVFTNPYIITDQGRFAPMAIAPAATSDPPTGWCFNNTHGEVTVPLTDDLFEWSWKIQIGILTTSELTGVVEFGDDQVPFTVDQGLSQVFVSVLGGGDNVRITGLPPDADVCVGDVQVGNAVPGE